MQGNDEEPIIALRRLNDTTSNSKTLTLIAALHQHSSAGDVDALRRLLDINPSLDVNAASRKRRNTALHYAVSQNQQGSIINYLLSKGADPFRANANGYTPIMLAIVNCNTTEALQKLLDAGAVTPSWNEEDRKALFQLAIQRNKKDVEELLLRYFPITDNEKQQESSAHDMLKDHRKATCPLCNCDVKFPSRMSFIPIDQKLAEQASIYCKTEKLQNQFCKMGESCSQQKPHSERESRVYLDQFLSSAAFAEMCKVEYHGVNNMHKLRKEVSESWAILLALQQTCQQLKLSSDMSQIMVVDLCSGKCLTTTMLSILYPKGKFLAVDKLPEQMVPHCAKSNGATIQQLCSDTSTNNRWYLSRDIRSKIFIDDLEHQIQRHCYCHEDNFTANQQQSHPVRRVVFLVGMHLCGHLSTRAIELFEKISQISALILSPCCLPRAKERIDVVKLTEGSGLGHENIMYDHWAQHLKGMVEKAKSIHDQLSMNSIWAFLASPVIVSWIVKYVLNWRSSLHHHS